MKDIQKWHIRTANWRTMNKLQKRITCPVEFSLFSLTSTHECWGSSDRKQCQYGHSGWEGNCCLKPKLVSLTNNRTLYFPNTPFLSMIYSWINEILFHTSNTAVRNIYTKFNSLVFFCNLFVKNIFLSFFISSLM